MSFVAAICPITHLAYQSPSCLFPLLLYKILGQMTLHSNSTYYTERSKGRNVGISQKCVLFYWESLDWPRGYKVVINEDNIRKLTLNDRLGSIEKKCN